MYTRREFLRCGVAVAGLAGAAPKPNIIYITADQQRSGDLACLGNPIVHTPHLDRLAREGVGFNRAFVQFPVCLPSRTSMLTGRYPHTHGVRTNEQLLSRDELTLPELLREHGYFTGATGDVEMELARRCDEYVPTLRQKGAPGITNVDRLRISSVFSGPEESHWDMRCMRETQQMLRRNRARPQFLYVAFQQPHLIIAPIARFAEHYPPDRISLPPSAGKGQAGRSKSFAQGCRQRGWTTLQRGELQTILARRLASAEMLDSFVGAIRATLEELDIAKNTIIVYQSDHGDYGGEFGVIEKVPTSLADALLRVPLIFWAPGRLAAHAPIRAMVEEIDVMPTLLELAGIERPSCVQGASLVPLMEGRVERIRDAVFAQTGQTSLSWMVRTEDWKFVFAQSLEHELYDLRGDPGETTNVAGSQPAIERQMQERLLSWLAESRMTRSCRLSNVKL